MEHREMVTVIIPVYNAEKYLNRCVDSILAQTYRNFEILLIDDGSTDISGKICDQYALQDTRIKVIHKKNAGVSAARNDGIDNAKGAYIAFIDADDWIEPEMYEKMIVKFGEYDVDFVRCNRIYSNWPGVDDGLPKNVDDRQLKGGLYDEKRKQVEIYPRLLVTDKMNMGPVCSTFLSVYKREFLNREKIRYEKGIKINEDLLFSATVVYRSKAFYYIEDGYYYHWFYNQKSASHSFHSDLFQSVEHVSLCLTTVLQREDDYDFDEQIARYSLFAMLLALKQRCAIQDFRERYRYIQGIVNSTINKKIKLKYINALDVSVGYKVNMLMIKLKLSPFFMFF